MRRFQFNDVIRHRTGVSLFHVWVSNLPKDMYLVKPEGAAAGVFQALGCDYVDNNFILVERRIHDEVITEDEVHAAKLACTMERCVVDMETGFVPMTFFSSKPRKEGKLAALAMGYGTDLNASSKKGVWVKADKPVNIDQSVKLPPDVAVTLEGLPEGYYLKAFRPAGPADLIIKTNGKICKEDCTYRKGKTPLLRPIVAEIPQPKPVVPGVPDGFELVRIGQAHPGELFLSLSGGILECVGPVVLNSQSIVRKKVVTSPCNGILPGIPLGFRVVRFGDPGPDEFYFDTVGTLKQGPSNYRIVVEKVEAPEYVQGHVKMSVGDSEAFKRWMFNIPVDNFGYGGKAVVTRNDARDAAVYAISHTFSNVQVECEFVNINSGVKVWTPERHVKMEGTHFTPTGRSRKVKVL